MNKFAKIINIFSLYYQYFPSYPSSLSSMTPSHSSPSIIFISTRVIRMNAPLLNNQNPPFNNQPYQNPYTPSDYAPAPPNPSDNYPNPYRNSQFAQDLNHLRAKEHSHHCQALVATLLLIAGVVTANVLYFFTDVQLPLGGFIGIICGSYVLYLIVGCCCNTLTQYLSNIDRGQNFETYYDRVREMIGRFVFHAECYHYEIRHHTRHVRDSNGNTRTQHYTTREKVVTHTATEYLTPYETRDESGKADRIRANSFIVFIHFFIKYRFHDPQSSNNFEQAYYSFKMRNTRDAHQDFTMRYDVPGFVERKAFYIGELGCDYSTWFYFFSMIGLIWPYSMWVESKISRFEIETMKVLKV